MSHLDDLPPTPGFMKLMVAYVNHHAFSYVRVQVREQRKDRKLLNQLENKGLVKPPEPYFCGVCDRRFYTNEKLINHFKQIHETENQKRMRHIESSKGHQRVRLVAKYSMKIDKYKRAARKIMTPKEGYGLADEWKEVVMGKAKKEVEKLVGKWNDRDVLKKLEWTYDPEKERGGSCGVWDYEFDYNDDEIENVTEVEIGDGCDWWKIDDNEVSVGSLRPS